jgi:hypothetical protein
MCGGCTLRKGDEFGAGAVGVVFVGVAHSLDHPRQSLLPLTN